MTPEKANVEAMCRIEKAKDTSASKLNLSHLDSLKEIPRELACLTLLQTLDLSYCHQLSGDLATLVPLSSLRSLDISFLRATQRRLDAVS